MKDVRDICQHDGDCRVWSINPSTGKYCKICDCGALRRAILTWPDGDLDGDPKNYDLWEVW